MKNLTKKLAHVTGKYYFCNRNHKNGAVVQMVRILACHARGREFEPRPHRRGVFHHGRLLAFCGQLSPAAPRGRGFPALRSESGKAGTSLVRTAEESSIMEDSLLFADNSHLRPLGVGVFLRCAPKAAKPERASSAPLKSIKS